MLIRLELFGVRKKEFLDIDAKKITKVEALIAGRDFVWAGTGEKEKIACRIYCGVKKFHNVKGSQESVLALIKKSEMTQTKENTTMKERCLCGKKVFGSLAVAGEEAADYAKAHPGHEMNAYECLKVPGNFHIGHIDAIKKGSLYNIPHTNLITLRLPKVNYLVAARTRIPIDAKIINEMLNKKDALIIAKTAGPGKWDCISPAISDEVHSFKFRVLLIEAWASSKIADPKSRIPWIQKTHDYLASEFKKVTADMVEEFVGYVEPEPVVEADLVFPYYMSKSCHDLAMNTGKVVYTYHTKKECVGLRRGLSGELLGLTDETLSHIPEYRRKLCMVCAGTAKKRTRIYLPPAEPTVAPPVVDTTEISIGNEVYVRKSSIPVPIPMVRAQKPQGVTTHSHVFTTEDELAKWAKEISLKPGDIVTFMNLQYSK